MLQEKTINIIKNSFIAISDHINYLPAFSFILMDNKVVSGNQTHCRVPGGIAVWMSDIYCKPRIIKVAILSPIPIPVSRVNIIYGSRLSDPFSS